MSESEIEFELRRIERSLKDLWEIWRKPIRSAWHIEMVGDDMIKKLTAIVPEMVKHAD